MTIETTNCWEIMSMGAFEVLERIEYFVLFAVTFAQTFGVGSVARKRTTFHMGGGVPPFTLLLTAGAH